MSKLHHLIQSSYTPTFKTHVYLLQPRQKSKVYTPGVPPHCGPSPHTSQAFASATHIQTQADKIGFLDNSLPSQHHHFKSTPFCKVRNPSVASAPLQFTPVSVTVQLNALLGLALTRIFASQVCLQTIFPIV